ncbi:tetratricopeptide repeat protein [Blastococcus sp. TF02A-35]|uniref:tetratricopeptide repeat protein n=1 Tax=Blastococcus sp. TF02A-35 TaxID=2559612 RepID=UPI0010736FB9|nr:tetratricopeptide repeat protein [Blastococcus sp. TF02A_35]TFV48188.1 tetratricopeptide repeat protein [Blastococcus sp. TF02A_35]
MAASLPDRPLAELSLDDLLDRYRELDLSAGDDEAADDARAEEADRIAAEVLRRDPADRGMWFDRGLVAKWRRDWPAASAHNARSLELVPEDERREEPAAWNLGIAATARRDWATARRAWAAYGIPVGGSGEEPVDDDLGAGAVRLNPPVRYVGQRDLEIDGRVHEPEVVWGLRIDPARIRIASVPTPGSGHRFGDVVLHDGEPQGTRRSDGVEFPVFDEIELWERSPVPTSSVVVRGSEEAVDELQHALDRAGLAVEDWTTGVGVLCRACSDGVVDDHDHHPHDHHPHDHDPHDHDPEADGGRRLGVAEDPEVALRVVHAWLDAAPGRESDDVVVELE